MKVAIGSDHAGFAMKTAMGEVIRALGHTVLDVGAFNETPPEYPDSAEAVGRAIVDGKAERGVLVCGSGVAANKLRGIRAAVCHDSYSAYQGVEHGVPRAVRASRQESKIGFDLALEGDPAGSRLISRRVLMKYTNCRGVAPCNSE
jgi:RpiB/LacA/LacB family sugar-phosphate isomerase